MDTAASIRSTSTGTDIVLLNFNNWSGAGQPYDQFPATSMLAADDRQAIVEALEKHGFSHEKAITQARLLHLFYEYSIADAHTKKRFIF